MVDSNTSSEDSEQEQVDKALQQAATSRKDKQKHSAKRNVRVVQPLKAGLQPKVKAGSTEEGWLRECEALYAKLPKASNYARHKIKVLSKAIELLKKDRALRTQEEAAELLDLLMGLKIAGAAVGNTAASISEGAADEDDVAMA